MPGHIGFPAYCQALARLPATAAQIAAATGLTPSGLNGLMRRLWQLRLVHPAGTGYRAATVWRAGDGAGEAGKRLGGPLRPYANHILFATMVRALEEAHTAKALGEEVGVSLLAAQTAIRHMRAAGLVHLSEWGLCSFGRPVAKFELGNGKDAPKPPPQSNQVKWARYQQRRTYKAIASLDARGLACT